MISITTTLIEVVAFAIAFSLGLVLMCKQDLFCFQLEFPYLFTDLGESLLRVLETEVRHWCLVVVMVCRLASAVPGGPAGS